MYIYHALINALSAHMIHINLNIIFYTHVEHNPTKTVYIFYTHVEHNPTKTVYIKYYKKNKTTRTRHTHTHARMHARMHARTHTYTLTAAETGY